MRQVLPVFGLILAPLVGLGVALGDKPAVAGGGLQPGDKAPNPELQILGGGAQRLLGDGKSVVVLVFFRPDNENSQKALRGLGACAREMKGKAVRWYGMVSDAVPPDEVRALVKAAEFDVPVLLDKGDAVYSALGVVLHPVVGVIKADGTISAYQQFRAVSFIDFCRAQVEFALGEIDREQLAARLDPKAMEQGGPKVAAHRNLRLAQALSKKRPDKALELARKALDANPDLAPAHALIAALLAEAGDCAGAQKSAAQALTLDATDATAKTVLETCKAPVAKASP